MLPKKKILILTADAGFGHCRAVTAIAAAIPDKCGPSYECQIINPVDDPRAPEIIRRPQVDYDWTIRNHPGAYCLSYRISDSNPASTVAQEFIADLMVPLFQEILKTCRPDAVISTYPLYNAAYQITSEVWKAITERDRRCLEEKFIESQKLGAPVWER